MEANPNPAPRAVLPGFFRHPWVWPLLVAIALALGFALTSLRQLAGRNDRAAVARMGRSAGNYENAPKDASPMLGLFSAAQGEYAEPAAAPAPVSAVRKVISTATLEIRVRSAAGAVDELSGLAVTVGGFVQSSSTATTEDGGHTATLILRVPADRFQGFLTAAGQAGKILRKEVSGQDVTEEYVDLQARLRNWENQERQLNLIMSRAKTVGEVLAVQDKLGTVRETIEQIQGKIKYYDYHVALATVTMSLFEGGRPASTPWILEELAALGRTLYGSFRGLLQVLLALVPWILAGWGLWALGRRTIFKPKD